MRACVLAAVLSVSGLLGACGGPSDSKGSPGRKDATPVVQPWGLAAPDAPAVDLEAWDTVIVLAIDQVLRSELIDRESASCTPRIDSILAGAMEVSDAIAASTAGNASLASLLTGRHVVEHGIVSLRDVARETLPDAERTLAEGFHDAGWTTIFSSGSPLHARGFSGFEQGFDHYEAPRLSEMSRIAGAAGNGALQPLKAALAAKSRVFALVAFDDLTARALRVPSPAVAAPFVRARLAPLAQERADIEAGLRTLDVDPKKGLDDLTQLLARARGSRASAAWNMALRDAYLSLIDGAVGEILDALEAAGRAERALVVVTGLRGTLPPGYSHESGASFTADAIRLPMAIRWPGGARRSEPIVETASLLDLPRALDAAFSLQLGETKYGARDLGPEVDQGPAASSGSSGVALVVDSQRKLFAAVAGDRHVERYSNGETIVFDRAGQKVRGDQASPPAAVLDELASFVEEATRLSVGLVLLAPDPALELELAWETGAGSVLLPGEKRPAVRGTIEFSGKLEGKGAQEEALALTERSTALRIRLRTPRPPSLAMDSVRFGDVFVSVSLVDLPVMFAPLDDVRPKPLPEPASGEAVPARLRFERADGLAWTLHVDGGAGSSGTGSSGAGSSGNGSLGPEGDDTEVLLSVWPPRAVTDALEVQAGGGTRSEPVPGRLDMVRIWGKAPLVCRVKKLAKEDFVVACRTPEGFLAPTEMEFHGLRFADAQAFEFVLPRWQPAASAALPSLDAALYAAPEDAAFGRPDGTKLMIRRTEFGPLATRFSPPDVSDAEELVRLAPGE